MLWILKLVDNALKCSTQIWSWNLLWRYGIKISVFYPMRALDRLNCFVKSLSIKSLGLNQIKGVSSMFFLLSTSILYFVYIVIIPNACLSFWLCHVCWTILDSIVASMFLVVSMIYYEIRRRGKIILSLLLNWLFRDQILHLIDRFAIIWTL